MLRSDLERDYASYRIGPSTTWRMAVGFLQVAGFRAAVLYRIGHDALARGHRIRAAAMTRLIRATCHMDIELSAQIGAGICFPHTWSIVIGGRSEIGRDCKVMQCVSLGGAGGRRKPDGQSQPKVGAEVLIGAGAKLIGPVTIGDGASIGANAVVTRDVPPGATAVGVPAIVTGSRAATQGPADQSPRNGD